MAETQTSPIQVQVVPSQPTPSIEDRFSAHLERMGDAPTTPGRPNIRQAPPTQETAPEPAPEAQTGEVESAEEHYEFEFKGNKYQVPKELKELHEDRLRQEDYTQKTQEVAELRRSAEALLQQSKHQQELQSALAPQINRLNAVNEQIAQYMKVDWNALVQQDANVAMQHSTQFNVLNTQKQALEREIQSTAQVHMGKITEAQKAALEASDKAMAQKVKGWTRDTGKALNDFARKAYGFTENEVNATFDPRALQMMHDAKSWQDLQSSKAQKLVVAQKTLKPAASTPAATEGDKRAELRKGMRMAKTDGERTAFAEKLFALKVR